MPEFTFKGLWDLWEPWERKMLIGFMILFFFLASGVVIGAYVNGEWKLWNVISNVPGTFAFASFLLGIFIYSHFKNMGIVEKKRIWAVIWKVGLFIGILFAIVFYLGITDVVDMGLNPEDTEESQELPLYGHIILFIGLFIAFFLACLVFAIVAIVGGMGVVGVIYLFDAGVVPVLLRWVKRITSRDHLGARALGWLLLIPDNLDTGTLTVDAPREETTFPWDRFKLVVFWQFFFGLIIATYLSFNPFLLESLKPEQLFNLVSNALGIIPLLVIPWFVILRLNVRIDGPVKDFTLYGGIRSRMLRTFLVIGSILIFIRITIEVIGVKEVLLNFTAYSISLLLFSVLFSFVYFNYFEFELAKRVVKRLPWMDPVDNEVPSLSGDEADGEVPESVC